MAASGTVFISGVVYGSGTAQAAEFERRGYRVFVGVGEGETSPAGTAIPLNVRSVNSAAAAVAQVVAEAGAIDILVNNAGILAPGPLSLANEDDFKKTLDINLLGAWRVTKAALPHMRVGGSIIMMTSLSGLVGMPDDGVYAASRFAAEGMAQSLASEVAPLGLRVAVIEPGSIKKADAKSALAKPRFPGDTGGETAEKIASDIVDVATNPQAPFRNPLGAIGAHVMQGLGLDGGARAEAFVKSMTGKNWRPIAA